MVKVHRRVAKLMLDVIGPTGDLPSEEMLAHQMKSWRRMTADKNTPDIHSHEHMLNETLSGVIRNRHMLRALVEVRQDLADTGIHLVTLARAKDEQEFRMMMFMAGMREAMAQPSPWATLLEHEIKPVRPFPTPTHEAPRTLQ